MTHSNQTHLNQPHLNQNIALVDKRPFFEKALSFGVQQGLIDAARCRSMVLDAAKGSLQVADFFGSSHLYADLEHARTRIVNLVSLYLEQHSDLRAAAESLRDNTFLSHSRGGNEMLKALHALPDSTVFGDSKAQSLKDFQDQRTLHKPFSISAYRKQLQTRQQAAHLLAAAVWLADAAQLAHEEFDFVSAESVIRSAVIMRAVGADSFPGRAGFAQAMAKLRSTAQASGKLKIDAAVLGDMPSQFRASVDLVRRQIEKQEAALLLNPNTGLDHLLNALEARYFIREGGLEDVAEFDAFVSKAWHQLTKGKEDPYSRLTALLCVAAGVVPKTMLTSAEAKAIARQVRAHGFDSVAVLHLIETAAPFELKDNLRALWQDEFLPEATLALCDQDDLLYTLALQFLKENCNIKAARQR